MRLFINRSQMTTKVSKNKKVHRRRYSCVPDESIGIYLFYIINKEKKRLYFKIFQHYSKAVLCPIWPTRK